MLRAFYSRLLYTSDLKTELLGTKPKFDLKPDVVPSLFSHRPPTKKPRLSSERRSKVKDKQKVSIYNFNRFFI